jgi:hypothetical protein
MIVTPVKLDIDFLKSDLVRSPGLHASTIYGELYKELEPKRYAGDIEDVNPLLLAMGTAWEKHFEYLLLANGVKVERPEEFMSPEGIAYSPDLILWNGVTRLGEIKLTSMSAKDMPTDVSCFLPQKLDKFQTQMMLYAYWLGLTDGWLAILFLNKPWAPDLRVFDLTWTDRELADNHRMCMNFARHKGLL